MYPKYLVAGRKLALNNYLLNGKMQSKTSICENKA